MVWKVVKGESVFEFDKVYDHGLVDGVHKVNLGIRTNEVLNRVGTGTGESLAQAVIEAVNKAIATGLYSKGFHEIPDSASVEYRRESGRLVFGPFEEEVEEETPEALARAYILLLDDFIVGKIAAQQA